jgi:uncharacterized SAM-binding protein YcdF (DUF218 family)
VGVAALILLVSAFLARLIAPASNTDLTRFDAIVVLGYPSDGDGNPSPMQLARVTEGVREYERGVAPRLIFTGGAAHNGFVEAESMARAARSMGVPDSAMLIEPQAMDTIQNARFSLRLLQEHDWRSAEVVSSAAHLPRAGWIFSRLPLDWRTHAAPALQPESAAMIAAANLVETVKTVRYLLWTRWRERYLP